MTDSLSRPRDPAATTAATTIGFVGLGNMGTEMSARLIAAGFTVHGFDISATARAALAAAGGVAHDNLGDAVRDAHVVILMLPSSDVVEAVARDPDFTPGTDATPGGSATPGENATSGRETVVIDMSSSEPARTQALAAELARRQITLVDAPVSGGVSGARAGRLTIMVGADAGLLDWLRPVLQPIGNPVHVGAVGAGHAIKALNNLLSATHLLSTAEVMAAGQRFGLDPLIMLDVFNNSSGQSGSTRNKWPNFVLPGTFNSGFALRLMVKDMRIALGLAEQVGAADQLSRGSLQLWAEAAEALPSTADHTELARWVQSESAPIRSARADSAPADNAPADDKQGD
jgi:3-hydroxyisobutyrate dehydrogenase